MLLSSLIAKPVLTKTGKKNGYVLNVRLNKTRTKPACYLCADEDEEEYILPARAVLSVEDALIVSDARLKQPVGEPSPLGLAAYTDGGKALGYVADLEFLSDGARLILSDHDTGVSVTRAHYHQAVIIRGEGKPMQKNNMTQKSAPRQTELKGIQKPADAGYNDRLNLLGRRVKYNVYDPQGKLLIGTGESITPAHLSLARRQNKLLELTVSVFPDRV